MVRRVRRINVRAHWRRVKDKLVPVRKHKRTIAVATSALAVGAALKHREEIKRRYRNWQEERRRRFLERYLVDKIKVGDVIIIRITDRNRGVSHAEVTRFWRGGLSKPEIVDALHHEVGWEDSYNIHL